MIILECDGINFNETLSLLENGDKKQWTQFRRPNKGEFWLAKNSIVIVQLKRNSPRWAILKSLLLSFNDNFIVIFAVWPLTDIL